MSFQETYPMAPLRSHVPKDALGQLLAHGGRIELRLHGRLPLTPSVRGAWGAVVVMPNAEKYVVVKPRTLEPITIRSCSGAIGIFVQNGQREARIGLVPVGDDDGTTVPGAASEP
ncbi:MAG: hypothetical protein AAGI50_04000 [Pseudomonadota bacterium]